MTTRFKREGPQRYFTKDPNAHIPFAREEDLPEAIAAGVLFVVAIGLLFAALWI